MAWTERALEMEELRTIVAFLDRELEIERFEDSSNNGLQVEGPDKIEKVCCGVDASVEFLEEARLRAADLAVCHHGISWGDSLKRITGLNYARISFLVRNGIALYACHLPLDAHRRHGNNALICKALGLRNIKPFAKHGGREIGFAGTFAKPMRYDAFKRLVGRIMKGQIRAMDFGKKTVRTVGVVSGGAGTADLEEACRRGLDAYVSGEASLAVYNAARDGGMNAIFAGHYATESFGVRALARLLRRRFKVEAEFVDLNVPY